jgi:hypothetical protein
MANEELKGLTKQDLIDIVSAAVAASHQLNPIEQRKYEQELQAQKRRDLAAINLAKIEEENMRNRKNGCSHSRYPMAMGKLGGHNCPKGQGEWTTGGQLHSQDLATMICQRCSWTWQFKPTKAEYEYIEQNGMMGMTPPDDSRLIKPAEEAVA